MDNRRFMFNNSLQYHENSRNFSVVIIKTFMILANRNFMLTVTKAWIFCTVEKDDINIINMFYDIPSMVRYYTELYTIQVKVTIA